MSYQPDNSLNDTGKPWLSIVILNWNVADLLDACLRSLPAAAANWWPRTEVIVVDNASTDNSLELVRANFPGIRLLSLPDNIGFSAGNNAGIRASHGRYIFLLNPDTVCEPGSISLLCDYIEAQPEVGIVGPRLLNPDGSLQPSRRRFPTLATALIESTPLQPLFSGSGVLRRFYMLDVPDGDPQQVDWLSGAALLCRRQTLQQVGLLDPGYFMFSEEVDLCRRAANGGWSTVYLPQSVVIHYGGQSTEQAVASRHINFNTSKARYFRKHEGRPLGVLLRLYLLASYAAQAASEAIKWLLGHKRPLRAARLGMYASVLRSRLYNRPARSDDTTRVLMITGEFPPAQGGVGDYTCHLTQALNKQGTATRVLTRIPDEAAERPAQPAHNSVLGTRYSVLDTPRITLGSILSAVRGTRSSVAHIQYQTGAYQMRPTINLIPLLLKTIWRGPTVVTFHDLLVPYLFPKAGPVRVWANRLLARSATAAITTNPADASRLRHWGVRRVSLIPIGSNIPNIPPAGFNRETWRAEHGITSGTTLIAYFGFLNSTKGIDDLLRALAMLRANKGGQSYRLMMVGGGLGSSDPTNRATASQLDDLARTLGVADMLLWTGYLSPRDVSAALLSADLAALPYADGASFRRGSLMAVLEHELPIVTTRPAADGGIWPIGASGQMSTERGAPQLQDGVNALLVSPGDAAELAAAIERVASDSLLRETLAAGSTELGRFFDWKSIAEMHNDLYNSCT
ncbi:MAG: glycosyltransferase [Chloroflexota bacterium]